VGGGSPPHALGKSTQNARRRERKEAKEEREDAGASVRFTRAL
jgi:hypothetical protein